MTYEEQLKKQQQEQQNAAGGVNLAAETEKNTTQESGAVQQTQNYLQQLLQNKPSSFNSQYLPQLETLYDKVMNRDKFSYDVASDPLYQQYKNQYAQMGQLAMQDAVGNAAALTGGYGNSWATTAGNQAYQGYLQQLNDKVPELYQTAYAQYAQEGEDLQNQLALTADLYNNEYSKYMDDLNYMQQMQQTAYERALSLMQMGLTPNAELLAQAGLTEDDAKQILARMSGSGSGVNDYVKSMGTLLADKVAGVINTGATAAIKKENPGVVSDIINRLGGMAAGLTGGATQNIQAIDDQAMRDAALWAESLREEEEKKK